MFTNDNNLNFILNVSLLQSCISLEFQLLSHFPGSGVKFLKATRNSNQS